MLSPSPGTEPHGVVGSVPDLRAVGRWFNPRLGQFSFPGLIIVNATRIIPLSKLCFVSLMVMWESLERILCRVLVKKTSEKHG